MSDYLLLKTFLKKDYFNKYRSFIKKGAPAEETETILYDIAAYFETFPDKTEVEIDSLKTFCTQMRHPDWNLRDCEHYNQIFKTLSETEETDDIDVLLDHFEKEYFYNKVNLLGQTLEPIEKVKEEVVKYDDCKRRILVENPADTPNDFDTIFNPLINGDGLQWRLNCLTNSQGRLCKGDFGILGAYINTGKTRFIASEATFMAPQIEEGKYILWFNNEGADRKVQTCVWCAALNKPIHEIMANKEASIEAYTKAMGGDIDKIRFLSAVGKSTSDIEKIIEKYPPGLIIFDQLDHISGFDKKSRKDVERLKHLYYWARELSVKHCPVIGVTQADASTMPTDNNGNVYPKKYIHMRQLNGSKIDKQANCDFIITIGLDQSNPNIRGIHLAKTKNAVGDLKWDVIFDGERCRYND